MHDESTFCNYEPHTQTQRPNYRKLYNFFQVEIATHTQPHQLMRENVFLCTFAGGFRENMFQWVHFVMFWMRRQVHWKFGWNNSFIIRRRRAEERGRKANSRYQTPPTRIQHKVQLSPFSIQLPSFPSYFCAESVYNSIIWKNRCILSKICVHSQNVD